MEFNYLDGWWTDAGTFESLLRASNLVANTLRRAVAREAAAAGKQLPPGSSDSP